LVWKRCIICRHEFTVYGKVKPIKECRMTKYKVTNTLFQSEGVADLLQQLACPLFEWPVTRYYQKSAKKIPLRY
jgi:hypothetical protein